MAELMMEKQLEVDKGRQTLNNDWFDIVALLTHTSDCC